MRLTQPDRPDLLPPVARVLDDALSLFGLGDFRGGFVEPEVRLHFGGGATLLGLSRALVTRARHLMEDFTKRRPVPSRQYIS